MAEFSAIQHLEQRDTFHPDRIDTDSTRGTLAKGKTLLYKGRFITISCTAGHVAIIEIASTVSNPQLMARSVGDVGLPQVPDIYNDTYKNCKGEQMREEEGTTGQPSPDSAEFLPQAQIKQAYGNPQKTPHGHGQRSRQESLVL